MADLRKILESFNRIEESSLTPVGVKHGLNPQQKSVKQMPALFKMKSQGPVLGGDIKDAPSKGYFVGGESEEIDEEGASPNGLSPDTKMFLEDSDNPMRDAVIGRISRGRMDLVEKYGLEAVMDAVDDVTQGDSDWEEIGSSDVSAYIKRVEDYLRENFGNKDIAEGATTEDVISTVKKKLGDYLADLSKEIKSDPDLKDKLPQDLEKISPAVKTITTDDGKEIKIHGNEDDGFRITIKNKPHSATFESLDHAVMACEMYLNRRRMRMTQNEDYLEER